MGQRQVKPEIPIPTYCINLIDSIERKERMKQRFQLFNFQNYQFIEAVTPNSPLVSYYYDEARVKDYSSDGQMKRDIACFASHLLAIRKFLSDDNSWFHVGEARKKYALILEDDVLFDNFLHLRLQEVIGAVPTDFSLLSLTYMANLPFELNEENGLYPIENRNIWGAQAYLISEAYALKVLQQYDKPWAEIIYPEKITSEILIRESRGYLAAIPLVLEDCIGSDRAPLDNPYHLKHFCFWGYHNYMESDVTKESPLRFLGKEYAWQIYEYILRRISQNQISQENVPEKIAEITKLLS